MSAPSDLPEEVFPPTLREVMLRPRWLALLAFCLVVAGVFAGLGHWQLERAIDRDPPPAGATEVLRPIEDVLVPGAYLPEPEVGQRVEVLGEWVPGDLVPVSSRFQDGVEGYWVTGQFRLSGTPRPVSLAVAIGWAPTAEAAADAVAALSAEASTGPVRLVGRIISDEGPGAPPRGDDPYALTRMSPAALLSRWSDVEELSVYRPYLASETASGGLADIPSRPPVLGGSVNWLNIFYAAEWAIFGGFAFYLWYRLARDDWERQVEDVQDAQAAAATSPSG